MISRIVTLQDGIKQPFTWSFIAFGVLIVATFAADIKSRKSAKDITGYYPILDLESVLGLTVFFVEIGVLFVLAYTGESPFVYFQF